MNIELLKCIQSRISRLKTGLQEERIRRRKRAFAKPIDQAFHEAQDVYLSDVLSGDDRLRDLREALDTFTSRSSQQRTMHELYTQANMRNIYQEDYDSNELRIKQQNYMDEFWPLVLTQCPRRFGKTSALAMFAAALLVTQPGLRIVIFSPGKRPSNELFEPIKKFTKEFRDVKGFDYLIIGKPAIDNEDTFEVIHPSGKRSVAKSLPALERTTRGQTGDVVILEEAAQMDQKFVLKVAVPIINPTNTCLIAISTILEDTNFYSLLPNAERPDGRKIFRTFSFTGACEDCLDKGIHMTCPHRLHERPPWLGGEKNELVKSLFIALGEEETFQREQLGLTTSSTTFAFPPRLLTEMFIGKPIQFASLFTHPKIVYVAFDPNMGGKGSDFGMASCFFNEGYTVYCGLESLPNKMPGHYKEHCLNHLRSLRAFPGLSNCLFALIPESNIPHYSREIVQFVQANIPFTTVMQKDSSFDTSQLQLEGYSGPRTEPKTKELLWKCFNEGLEARCLVFYEHFVTSTNIPAGETDPHRAAKAIKKRARDQLGRYAIIRVPAKDEGLFGRVKATYSGKRGGNPDDLAMVMQLANFWMRQSIVTRGLLSTDEI